MEKKVDLLIMSDLFKKTIKPAVVEEWVDYYVFRRLAAKLIEPLARIGMTPNGVTWLGLGTGLSAAFLFYKGYFLIGILGLFLTVVLDCSDGMLARYTGKSSPYGRILDGSFDAVWTSAIWIAIYMSGELKSPQPPLLLYLMSFAGASMCLHCWTFDAVKTRYLEMMIPSFKESDLTREQALEYMQNSLKQKRYFEALIYFVMSIFKIFFGTESHKATVIASDQREKAAHFLDSPMTWWTFVGEGTHHFIMIFLGLFTLFNPHYLVIVFYIIAGPLNLIWLVAALRWQYALKKVKPFLISL